VVIRNQTASVCIPLAAGAQDASSVLFAGFVQGIAILVMVASLTHLSGGHVNPAVSFCLWITGTIPFHQMVGYVISQIAGSLCGAGLFLASTGWDGELPEPSHGELRCLLRLSQ
jgi:glycerol uptake facilitator-like aquaporin